jgi:hypothetical protein
MSWTVPGYAVERMLGLGSTGEVWGGRELATGERVALKRLRPGSANRDVLRHEAVLLAAFRHPHVVRLRGVLSTADGLVLVLDLAEGGSFAGLLGTGLPAAEVGGLCAPLASALAAAHAEGLIHGDIAPGNLLLDARGRPLLADLGTARLAGDVDAAAAGTPGYLDPAVEAGAPPSAASDVYGLAAVAVHLLTGQPPPHADSVGCGPLLPELLVALGPDPARRPTAAALAGIFERAARDGWARGEPMPVAARRTVLAGATTRAIPRPVTAAPAPEPWWRRVTSSIGRHRRVSAAFAVGAAAVITAGIVVPAAAAGLLAGRGEDRPAPAVTVAASPGTAPSARREVTAPTALRTAIEALDRVRSAAFARGDEGALLRVYLPGSPAAEADTAALLALERTGLRAVGLRHVVASVRILARTEVRARVLLADRMPGYRLVDRRGTVLRKVPPRGVRTFRVDLVATRDGWRIQAVSEPGRQ